MHCEMDRAAWKGILKQASGIIIDELSSHGKVGLLRQAAPETTLALQACGDMLCQVLPSGSGFENENNLRLFTSLIHAARRTLVITNPYFVPDDALMTAITSAAQRGVDVTLINSEASDQFLVSHAQRSYYEELLKAGVKIYWYDARVVAEMRRIEEGYLHKSRPVLLGDWQTRSAREKLFENISRLTAALQ
jgi:cardiolipin synthase A/B